MDCIFKSLAAAESAQLKKCLRKYKVTHEEYRRVANYGNPRINANANKCAYLCFFVDIGYLNLKGKYTVLAKKHHVKDFCGGNQNGDRCEFAARLLACAKHSLPL